MAKQSKSAPPTAEQSQDAIAALVAAIKEAEEAARRRLPPELQGSSAVVEQVVNAELDKVSFSFWRGQIVSEIVSLITSGKSSVKHDATELA